MSSLERKMGIWCAGYDAAVKEILSAEILPPEIKEKLKQWSVLKEAA